MTRPGLPTWVIGGYLGAGKTTLVNHLLRHAGQRIAVLVNDFGDLDIDADLIEGQDGSVISLAGGCVCCSFGSDLVGSLIELTQRASPPQLLLIETSGVALPAAVARSAGLAPGIELRAVVVVADVMCLRERAADPYVGDTVRQQLQDADLLLLNKCDLASADQLQALGDWVAAQLPQIPVLALHGAQLPPAVLLDLSPSDPLGPQAGAARFADQPLGAVAPPASALFETRALQAVRPTDLLALSRRLAQAPGLVRAKGVLTDLDGQTHVLNVVGTRADLRLAPSSSQPGRLVVIGLKGQLHLPDLYLA